MTGPYASPVPTITRRTDAPTVHVERRRRAIHVVVISHDHYDHLDQPPR
jgi:L-ascorbate metabolism protein UlaG (beta-lactamase superfamily)